MSPGAGRFRGRCKAILAAMLAMVTSVAVTAACDDRSLAAQAAYLSNSSEWFEFNAAGRELVHETGTLQGMELAMDLRCADWQWQGAVALFDGVRRYDGETSMGVPVISQSAIRQLHGHVQTTLPVSDAWRLGARLSGQTLWRDIASAGGATGYSERYEWMLASLGAQWRSGLGPGQIMLALWTGTALQSGMLLSHPSFAQTRLPLGSITQYELSAGWRTRWRAAWSLQLEAAYRQTDMAQGAQAILTRSGVPVGVAHQPRTSMVDMPLGVRINYEF